MRYLPILAILAAGPAAAQSQCGPADQVLEGLAAQWGEYVAFMGIAANGLPLEIMLNPATGSWTALVLLPDGVACVLASGDDGERVAPDAI